MAAVQDDSNDKNRAHGTVILSEVFPKVSQRFLPPFSTLSELMEAAGERYASRDAIGVKTVIRSFL
jgi:hypothetical protein